MQKPGIAYKIRAFKQIYSNEHGISLYLRNEMNIGQLIIPLNGGLENYSAY